MSLSEPNRTIVIRVKPLVEEGVDDDLANTTAAERFDMMWQLAEHGD